MKSGVEWLPHQRDVLLPPDGLSTTEWAEQNLMLPSRLSPLHAGPYSADITPYMREPQDVMADDEHQVIVIRKSVQCGGSQATRNAILRWLTKSSAPILLVYPDEDSAKFALDRKVLPSIRACAPTAAMIAKRKWDTQKHRIALTTTDLACGWSGSAQSIASDPFRYLICDEVDNFAEFAGTAADPVSLAIRRTTTFGARRKVVLISTPTTPDGVVSREFDECGDQRDYWLACPHCSEWFIPTYRLLTYNRAHKGPLAEATRLEKEQPVQMACPSCGSLIPESAKASMVRSGCWRSRGCAFGESPTSERVGFQVSGLVSLIGPSWSKIVANHLRARGDYAALMDFFNNDLGEPFENRLEAIRSDVFDAKRARGHAPAIVPPWGAVLVATADAQGDHFWYTVRAWGRGGISRGLSEGRVESFADLYQRTLGARWQVEGTTTLLRARMLLVDSGGTRVAGEDQSMTEKVYRFSKIDPAHIWPCKGRIGQAKPVAASNVTYKPPGFTAGLEVLLRLVDVGYFKDVLAHTLRLGLEGPAEEEIWQEHNAIGAAYAEQMTAEHKVSKRRGSSIVTSWQVLSAGAPNHLWDCAVLQCAGAYMLEMATLPDEMALRERREQPKKAPPPSEPWIRPRSKGPWVNTRGRPRY